jgi:hypothetical protein
MANKQDTYFFVREDWIASIREGLNAGDSTSHTDKSVSIVVTLTTSHSGTVSATYTSKEGNPRTSEMLWGSPNRLINQLTNYLEGKNFDIDDVCNFMNQLFPG